MTFFDGLVSLNLTVPGLSEPVPFLHFAASRQHIVSILEGHTYPVIPDLGPVKTILDIGANVGASSVMMAIRNPAATVHAFEPGPIPLDLLRRNASHFPSIVVHPFGLGEEDKEMRLFRSRWDPMSASVLPSTENIEQFDDVALRRVSTNLDASGIGNPDIIKIDTEGCEVAILRDLGDRMRAAQVLYLEYHSEEDRLEIDSLVRTSHVLAHAIVRHPHRGDLCYVNRSTKYSDLSSAMVIRGRL